ncbi:ParA family partition ATPase [Aeromonas hydrophila]
MKVVSVLNQKGGSGKTTIATHLAMELKLRGFDVVLVDSDPQGSARDWAAVADGNELPVIGIDRPTLERDIKALGRRDFIVIDGAPQAADLAISAIKSSDLIIIPVQPSPYDIWATSDLVDLVKQRIDITDGKLKAVFVVSRAIKNTKIGGEIETALLEYGVPVLKARICQSVLFPTSAANGVTVIQSSPNSPSADEVVMLTDEVVSILIGEQLC